MKVVPEYSAGLLLYLAWIGMDTDLERLKVLVDEVFPTTRTTRGFPAGRFYQEVWSRFQIARQLSEVQGFKGEHLLRSKAMT